jgi:hypothetical protein
MSNGLMFGVNYTFSKAINSDDNEEVSGTFGVAGGYLFWHRGLRDYYLDLEPCRARVGNRRRTAVLVRREGDVLIERRGQLPRRLQQGSERLPMKLSPLLKTMVKETFQRPNFGIRIPYRRCALPGQAGCIME